MGNTYVGHGNRTIDHDKPLTLAERAEKKVRRRYRRPRTRGECADGPRPCPFALCRYHLFVDVTGAGSLLMNHPGKEIDQLEESCALDVADRGGQSLEAVGRLIGVSMERSRQIIEQAATGISFVSVHRLRRKPPASPVKAG